MASTISPLSIMSNTSSKAQVRMRMNSVSSLPVIAKAATIHTREDVNEVAYEVFSKLSGTRVNYLDRRKLEAVLAERGVSPGQ